MAGYRYGVLGAGRQGTAAAYDLAVRGEADRIALADVDAATAEAAARRVDRLVGRSVASAGHLDVADEGAVRAFLEPLDSVVSAVPFHLNLGVAQAAIAAGTHHCDLGGNMGVVRSQLALDEDARRAGVCVVPDCGEAPGLANNLVAYAMSLLEEPEEVELFDGGLPRDPVPPWNYEVTFYIGGLTNEYDGTTTWIVDRRLVEIPCLDPSADATADFGEPYGRLEAFSANTASTVPETLGPRLRSFSARVLRYPGHIEQFRAFRDLGLFDLEPIEVDGAKVVPRDVFHALLEPRIRATEATRDVVINRVVVRGRHRGASAEAVADLFVHHDEDLGFTAMEQATGWHAAIVCHLMAAGRIAPGATPVELAVEPGAMMEAALARGFELRHSVTRM